jgi:transcriptional regulator with XRE-family HTH domain
MVANTKQDFATRLVEACANAEPPIMSGRGQRAELCRRVKQHGLTVSGESVRKWLAGESIPSMDNIRYIALALGVEAEWLLTGRSAQSNERRTELIAREPKGPVYHLMPQAIQDVIAIMQTLDATRQSKVLFAAQLAKHEQDEELRRNSIQRAGS